MDVRLSVNSDRKKLTDLIDSVCAEGLMVTTRFLPTPDWLYALESPGQNTHLLLVAQQDTDIVGWCRLFPVADTSEVELGIGVTKAYRNQGIGSSLLYTAINWAREKGSPIVLQTHKDNAIAHKLFNKFGFILTGEQGNFFDMRLSQVEEL